MSNARSLLLYTLIALATAGCKKKPEGVPLPNHEIDAAMPDDPAGDVRRMADRMCACPDLACVDRVQQELAVVGHRYRDNPPPSPAVAKAIAAEAQRLEDCARRIGGPDGGH